MNRFHILTVLLLFSWGISAQNHFDIVVVGGNPGGIMAAIAAARQGKTSVILERTQHIGGLPANGLGATDIATREATTGLFMEFTSRIKQYYTERYGKNSQQLKDCSDGFHFEPSVAASIYQDMLNEHKDKITVLLMRQFDAEDQNITLRNGRIESICILNRENGEKELYQGDIFVDATYEGDLGAAAGVRICFAFSSAAITECSVPFSASLKIHLTTSAASLSSTITLTLFSLKTTL